MTPLQDNEVYNTPIEIISRLLREVTSIWYTCFIFRRMCGYEKELVNQFWKTSRLIWSLKFYIWYLEQIGCLLNNKFFTQCICRSWNFMFFFLARISIILYFSVSKNKKILLTSFSVFFFNKANRSKFK